MICLENVSKTFAGESIAVSSCSFSVSEQSLAILGEKGAGKTTLAKLICGIISQSSGRITVDGEAVSSEKALQSIGYMAEACPLAPALSVKDSLSFIAKMRGLDSEAVNKAIKSAGLSHSQSIAPVGILGKASKKRASLAVALLGCPRYLVLDQPLSELSEKDEAELLSLLSDLSQNHVLIYLSDTLEDATELCQEAVLLSSGKVALSGSFEEILEPKAEYVEYKLRVRGDKTALKELLDTTPRLSKYTVNVTTSGAFLISLSVPKSEADENAIKNDFASANLKLSELKRVRSSGERVLEALRRNQEAKNEKRRLEAEAVAPPIKLDAETISFMHSDEDERETGGSSLFGFGSQDGNGSPSSESNESYTEETERETVSGVRKLSVADLFHSDKQSQESEDGENSGESTLFSSAPKK